jgi:sulfate adenylyltransferase
VTITAEIVEQTCATPTIAPHGGRLINRLVDGAEAEELHRRAQHLPALRLTTRQLSDLELIANGAFSPLEGFMRQADYERVVDEMRLANGLPWSIPVTLAVAPDEAPAAGAEVALHCRPPASLRKRAWISPARVQV